MALDQWKFNAWYDEAGVHEPCSRAFSDRGDIFTNDSTCDISTNAAFQSQAREMLFYVRRIFLIGDHLR